MLPLRGTAARRRSDLRFCDKVFARASAHNANAIEATRGRRSSQCEIVEKAHGSLDTKRMWVSFVAGRANDIREIPGSRSSVVRELYAIARSATRLPSDADMISLEGRASNAEHRVSEQIISGEQIDSPVPE